MDSLPAFVAGVVVGLVLAGLFAWARRGSVTDLGAASTAAAPPAATVPPDERHLGIDLGGKTVIHRVSARLEPDGRLTIEADGRTYGRLEDVPDAATRDQVRTILASLPAQMKDPAQRDRVEAELREAGIDAAEPVANAASEPASESTSAPTPPPA